MAVGAHPGPLGTVAGLMDRLEAKIHALYALAAGDDPAALRRRLATILRGKSGILIERAARIVRDQRISALQGALVTAFDTLCVDGKKRDPGCAGKTACLTALDHLDHPDRAVFERAAKVEQVTFVWGQPPVDHAVPVRARAALAVSRFSESEASTLLGTLLADPYEEVRRAAIEGLGGRPDASGMLALRWSTMDTGAPIAQLECGTALIRATGALGVSMVARALADDRPSVREIAALALAESRSAAALAHLVSALDTAVEPDDRKRLVRALAAHRSPGAVRALDDLVEDGSDADVRLVLAARLELPIDPQDRADLLDRAAARGVRLLRD